MNPIPSTTYAGGFAEAMSSCRWASFDASTGISSGAYKYGNICEYVGDDPFAVNWNRERIKESFAARSLISAKQVHGCNIFISSPNQSDIEVEGYDAIISNVAGQALMIQQADCQAILLFDPKGVVAAIHAGWRGNVDNIIGKTISCCEQEFSSLASDIHAFISPSLGPCCAEFVNYKKEFPSSFTSFMTEKKSHFNLWQVSRSQLIDAGVKPENITMAEDCTSCNDNYFSYRRACREGDGVTGRNCSVIMLEE
ncbi:MAG: peptidoglycan editing factor PgeF [Desulfotalea sp.]